MVLAVAVLAGCMGGAAALSRRGEAARSGTTYGGPLVSALARHPRRVFGVAYGDVLPWMSPSQLDSALDDAVALGTTWVRLDFSWADVQPNGPLSYDWGNLDRVVAAARARKLNLLPTLAYTPAWARSPDCSVDKCPPESSAAFAAFAKAATARYAPKGVHTWEIWNEENSPRFWSPKPSPRAYTALLKATASAIRSVDPHAFIVSGGLTATLTVQGAMDTRAFLEQICALGANRVVDAVGYHPYTYPTLASFVGSWATAWNKISETSVSIVSILAEYGTPHLPVWITEYGAPTGGPGAVSDGSPAGITSNTDHVTDGRQAQIASDAVRTVDASTSIAAMFWYTDRDLPGSGTPEDFYGLRRADGTKKPSFTALARAIRAGGS